MSVLVMRGNGQTLMANAHQTANPGVFQVFEASNTLARAGEGGVEGDSGQVTGEEVVGLGWDVDEFVGVSLFHMSDKRSATPVFIGYR